MVPAMMLFMSMDIKRAVGTSLAVIIPTALMGSFKHYQQGNLDWRAALALAPMAILVLKQAYWGEKISDELNSWQVASQN